MNPSLLLIMLSFALFVVSAIMAAPAAGFVWNDPTTYPTNFDTVDRIEVRFSPHHQDHTIHKYLQSEYGGWLFDLDALFQPVIAPDGTTVHDRASRRRIADNAVRTLRHRIRDELILANHPGDDPDLVLSAPQETHARQFILQAGLRIGLSDKTMTKLRNAEHVANIFSAAVSRDTPKTYFQIEVLTNHVYFRPHLFDPTDWSTYHFTAPMLPPPPPTAIDIAAAVAGSVPSAADMGHAISVSVSNALAPVVNAITTAGVAAPTAPTPAHALSDSYRFIPGQLPPPVRERYDRVLNNQPVLGNDLRQYPEDARDPLNPLYPARWYYEDLSADPATLPNRIIILATGHPFVIETPNEKGLLRRPIKCTSSRPEALRHWYQMIHRHARDHGYYIHPLYAFRKNHGGNWGFTAGPSDDDDLPQRLSIPLDGMKQAIFRLVQDCFTSDPKISAITSQCNGDGYLALKQIVRRIHPNFHPTPAILIKQYPIQRTLTLVEYYYAFKDYLQLRAFIRNIDVSLDDPDELDVFISGCKHSEFLQRCVRDERTSVDPLIQAKYTDAQIVDTLTYYLLQPDSPALQHSTTTSRPAPTTRPTNSGPSGSGRFVPRTNGVRPNPVRSSPQPVAVHSILQGLNLHGNTSSSPDVSPDASYEGFSSSVSTLPIPSDPQSRSLGHIYAAAVHAIQDRPTAAVQTPCICCNENHRFDECPILANTEYLRGHYIRFCQYIRREAERRNAAFNGSQARLPVNQVDVQPLGFVSTSQYETHVTQESPDSHANDDPPEPAPTSSDEYEEIYGQYSNTDDSDPSPSDSDPPHFL